MEKHIRLYCPKAISIMKINTFSQEDVINKIKELQEKDQEFLRKHKSMNQYELKKIFHDINKENCMIMRQIIKQHGLISISKFGEETSHAAWLLVQHFPKTSVRFMEKYLKMMKENPSEVSSRNIAYLDDRVNSHLGQPLKFGTQGFKRKGSSPYSSRYLSTLSGS